MRLWSLVVALAVLLSPLAIAQDTGAPHPAPDQQTLYAHGTGDDEYVGFMNTLQDDGSDGAMGSGDALTGSQTWTWTLDPALAGTLLLDGEGMITVSAYVGGSTHLGDVSVSMELKHGDETVAVGDAQDHTITPADAGSGPYGEVTWSLTPQITSLEPGADLVWSLTVDGTASAVFVGTGEGRGRTNMVLPILEARLQSGPAVIYEDVDTEDLSLSLDLNGTARYVYNWTMGPAKAVVFGQGNVSAGNVTVRVMDAANATVFEAVLAGPVNVTQQFDGTAGNWTLHVNATEASGNVSLLFGPPTPTGTGSGTGTSGTNGTATMTTTSKEESPALPAIGLVLLLALLARRRR